MNVPDLGSQINVSDHQGCTVRCAVPFPSPLVLTPLLRQWLLEDIGRGDRTTEALLGSRSRIGVAQLRLKQPGVVAGLPLIQQVYQLLEATATVETMVQEGDAVNAGTTVAQIEAPYGALLSGERVVLNLVMWLSGIATLTRRYTEQISDLPTVLVDTRKTTPGLRLLEKYATAVGGAQNHRYGLDDAAMIKDNHIAAAGGIEPAVACLRQALPFPLTIEVETETLTQVETAVACGADVIMLDNMPLEQMRTAVAYIRSHNPAIRIEASGNVTLQTLRAIAETGVDYISSSAPITQATWLDFSLRIS